MDGLTRWLLAQEPPGRVGPAPALPVLRIDGRVWRDGDRLYVPRWVSHLSALQPARSENDWRVFFDWAVRTGFTGTRLFCGNLGWASGQTAESARQRLPRYLDVAAEYGLAVEVTALTGTGD